MIYMNEEKELIEVWMRFENGDEKSVLASNEQEGCEELYGRYVDKCGEPVHYWTRDLNDEPYYWAEDLEGV